MKRILFIILILCTFIISIYPNNEINDLLNELKKSNNIEKSKLLNKITRAFYKKKMYKKAKEYSNISILFSNKNNFYIQEIIALKDLSLIFIKESDFKKADEYLNKALNIAKNNKDHKQIMYVYAYKKYLCSFNNDYKSLLSIYKKELLSYKEKKDKKMIANSIKNIGTGNLYLGNFKKALKYYFKSLAMFKEIKETKTVIQLLTYVAKLNLRIGYEAKFLKYNLEAEKLLDKNKYSYLNFRVNHNYAYYYEYKKNVEKAIFFYNKSIKGADKKKHVDAFIKSHLAIVNIHIEKKNFLEAESLIKKSEFLNKTNPYINISELKMKILLNKGRIFLGKDDLKKAKKYIKEYFDFTVKKEKSSITNACYHMGFLYFIQNDFNKAENYFKKGLNSAKETFQIHYYKKNAAMLTLVSQELKDEKNYKKYSKIKSLKLLLNEKK